MVESGAVIAPSRQIKWHPTGRVVPEHAEKAEDVLPFFSAGEAGRRLRGPARLTINHPVELRVSQDDLHVFACFSERNGLDEFGSLFVVALGLPRRDTVFARIVRSGGRFERSELLHQVGDVHHPKFDVVVGIEELVLYVADFDLPGEKPAGLGEHLHEANSILVRDGVRLESGFLADQASRKHRIEIVLGGLASKCCFVRQRKKLFPGFDGYVAEFASVHVRNSSARVGHACAKVPLIKSRLRGFKEKTWGRAGEVSVLQLLFGRRIKSNGAKRLSALPALFGSNGNRLVKGTQRRRGRNFLQELRWILFARS